MEPLVQWLLEETDDQEVVISNRGCTKYPILIDYTNL